MSLSEATDGSKPSSVVRFDSLDIIEFPMELGDNPAVSCGAPVCLGNKVQSRQRVDLYQYEAWKGTRRHRDELWMTVPKRAGILLRAGYTINEIADSVEETLAIRKNREESYKNQKWDNFSFGTMFKNVFNVTAKSA